MAERVFHQENLARIECRITELKRKISGLHERLQMLETTFLSQNHRGSV
jgi:hypothetical protein